MTAALGRNLPLYKVTYIEKTAELSWNPEMEIRTEGYTMVRGNAQEVKSSSHEAAATIKKRKEREFNMKLLRNKKEPSRGNETAFISLSLGIIS